MYKLLLSWAPDAKVREEEEKVRVRKEGPDVSANLWLDTNGSTAILTFILPLNCKLPRNELADTNLPFTTGLRDTLQPHY
jgi:hypothetical protein